MGGDPVLGRVLGNLIALRKRSAKKRNQTLFGKSTPRAPPKVLCFYFGPVGEAVMRPFGIILAVAVTAACSPALAQVVAPQATPLGTPNVVNPGLGLATPLTSTTTNCMMLCNSQAANCKTTCVLPVPPTPLPSPSSSAAPILNATPSTACLVGCGSTQLACQSGCALNSPSR